MVASAKPKKPAKSKKEAVVATEPSRKGIGGRSAWVPTPEILAEAERLAGLGLMDKDIALCLKISPSTFYAKLNEYPELSEALKRGQAEGIKMYSEQLYEHSKRNLGATIFYLKCKAGWKEDGTSSGTSGSGRDLESVRKSIRESLARAKRD